MNNIKQYEKYKNVESKGNGICFDYVYETKYAYHVFTKLDEVKIKENKDKTKKPIFYYDINEKSNIEKIIEIENREIKESSENYNIYKNSNFLKKLLYDFKIIKLNQNYISIFEKYQKTIDLNDIMKYKLDQIFNSDFFIIKKEKNYIDNNNINNKFNNEILNFKGFIGYIEYNKIKQEKNKVENNFELIIEKTKNDFNEIFNCFQNFVVNDATLYNIGLNKLYKKSLYDSKQNEVKFELNKKDNTHKDQKIILNSIIFEKNNNKLIEVYISHLTEKSKKLLIEQIKNSNYIFEINSLESTRENKFD